MKKANLIAAVICAAVITSGCNKQSTEANIGTNSVNNVVSATATNVWNATKSVATNAWAGTKEAGSNAWQKAREAFASGIGTNEVSTNYFGYDYSQKGAFVSQARMSLTELDLKASNLSNRIATASDSTKADLQQTWRDIQSQRAELDRKFDDVKNASQDNWNDAKAAFTKTYHDVKADLKAGWDSVTSKL